MMFKNYQEIARHALRLNDYKPHVAAAEIGIDPEVFCDVLTGGYPDLRTIYRFLVFRAYLECERFKAAREARS